MTVAPTFYDNSYDALQAYCAQIEARIASNPAGSRELRTLLDEVTQFTKLARTNAATDGEKHAKAMRDSESYAVPDRVRELGRPLRTTYLDEVEDWAYEEAYATSFNRRIDKSANVLLDDDLTPAQKITALRTRLVPEEKDTLDATLRVNGGKSLSLSQDRRVLEQALAKEQRYFDGNKGLTRILQNSSLARGVSTFLLGEHTAAPLLLGSIVAGASFASGAFLAIPVAIVVCQAALMVAQAINYSIVGPKGADINSEIQDIERHRLTQNGLKGLATDLKELQNRVVKRRDTTPTQIAYNEQGISIPGTANNIKNTKATWPPNTPLGGRPEAPLSREGLLMIKPDELLTNDERAELTRIREREFAAQRSAEAAPAAHAAQPAPMLGLPSPGAGGHPSAVDAAGAGGAPRADAAAVSGGNALEPGGVDTTMGGHASGANTPGAADAVGALIPGAARSVRPNRVALRSETAEANSGFFRKHHPELGNASIYDRANQLESNSKKELSPRQEPASKQKFPRPKP